MTAKNALPWVLFVNYVLPALVFVKNCPKLGKRYIT